MKLYFAWYIPVDGEITWEMGEIPLFYYDLNNKGYLCTGKRMPNLQVKCTLNNGHVFYEGHARFKQAKLYICSRNITTGDKVKFRLAAGAIEKELQCIDAYMDDKIDGGKSLTVVLEDGEYKIYTTPDTTNQCYKVLGSVSENATWVTDGMQFDREDLLAQGVGVNWCDSNTNLKFKIKGPCGHFH